MSPPLSLFLPPLISPLHQPHAHLIIPTYPMTILRHHHHHPRRLFSLISAAILQDTTPTTSTVWTPTPISLIKPAAESLFHVSIDVSDAPEIATSYTRPGQYLQLKVPYSPRPSFLAIASPPSLAATRGVFEFLVKAVAGSTAEILCGLKKGDAFSLRLGSEGNVPYGAPCAL